MNFLKVARFRKPERTKKQNKLSRVWGLWMVELGSVYNRTQQLNRTLCQWITVFPVRDEFVREPFKGFRILRVPGSLCPPLLLCLKAPLPLLTWGLHSRVCDRVWLAPEAGIRGDIPDSHTHTVACPSFGVGTLGDRIPGWHFWPFSKLSVCSNK